MTRRLLAGCVGMGGRGACARVRNGENHVRPVRDALGNPIVSLTLADDAGAQLVYPTPEGWVNEGAVMCVPR